MEANTKRYVSCSNCGQITTSAWSKGNFLGLKKGWRDPECPTCRKTIVCKDLTFILCPSCGQLTQRRANENTCLACKAPLFRNDEVTSIRCGSCYMDNLVPYTAKPGYLCAFCQEPLDLSGLHREKTIVSSEAQVIALKNEQAMREEKLAMWKHPVEQFPYHSRMIVHEGTSALLLQNGACQEPYGPGDYLLEKSDLQLSKKLEAAANDEGMVFNTAIYCVLENLPEMTWGTSFKHRETIFSISGAVAYRVCDARAFASRIGYGETTLAELVRDYDQPGVPDGAPGRLKEPTQQRLNDALGSTVSAALANGMTVSDFNDECKPMLRDRLSKKLDEAMADMGLSVAEFTLRELHVSKSEAVQNLDKLRRLAAKARAWGDVQAVLHLPENDLATASYTFSGTALLEVCDEARFKAMHDEPDDAYFSALCRENIQSFITAAAQNLVNNGIATLRSLSDHIEELTEAVQKKANASLSVRGLRFAQIIIDPPARAESDALRSFYARAERRGELRRCAESPLKWKLKSVTLCIPGHPELGAAVTFSGACTLRVIPAAANAFFASSDVSHYVEGHAPINAGEIRQFYTEKVANVLFGRIAQVAQNVVTNTQVDLRSLESCIQVLTEAVKGALAESVEPWSMYVESLTLDKPEVVLSETLQKYYDSRRHSTDVEIAQRNRQIDANDTISQKRTEATIQNAFDDIDTESREKHNDALGRQLTSDAKLKELTAQLRINQERYEAEIRKAQDDLASEQEERDYQRQRDAFRRKSEMNEAAIQKTIREDRMWQQAKAEAERETLDARFDLEDRQEAHDTAHATRMADRDRAVAAIQLASKLDEARFRETLNGIMHAIDESDLAWNEKLDAYNRLQKQLDARDTSDFAALHENTAYTASMNRIKLEGEQAALKETIERYSEERERRVALHQTELEERKADVAYRQQMEKERERVANEMQYLKLVFENKQAEREYQLKLDEKNKELTTLELELNYYRSRDALNANVETARVEADKAKKQAESEYLARKAEAEANAQLANAEKQANADAKLADRAMELYKHAMQMMKDFRMADTELSKHRMDTNVQAEKVRANDEETKKKLDEILTALIGKNTEQHTSDMQQFEKLIQEMEKIIKAQEKTASSLENLRRQQASGSKKSDRPQCPYCRYALSSRGNFCPNCGKPLNPAAPAQPYGAYPTGQNTAPSQSGLFTDDHPLFP